MAAYLTVGLWLLECVKANRTDTGTIKHSGTGSEYTQILVLALSRVMPRLRDHHAYIFPAQLHLGDSRESTSADVQCRIQPYCTVVGAGATDL